MVAEIIRQLDFNLAYAKKLVQDINEEQMTIKPGIGLENHPAFTLGHIVTSYANLVNLLTGEFILADGFKEAFQRMVLVIQLYRVKIPISILLKPELLPNWKSNTNA